MPRKCKYRCNGCGHENTYEVPDFEGDYMNYGNKLPCGRCGQIAGMSWMEDLGFNWNWLVRTLKPSIFYR